jgi:hypothetical protein
VKDSYKLIASLHKHALRPFIDEKKLLLSHTYSQALGHCVEHAERHGDFTLLGGVVNVFETRDFKLFVNAWVCERLGLKSKAGPLGVVFSRSGSPSNTFLSFKASLNGFASNKFKIAIPVAADAKEKRAPKRIDMLDSWARMPGSYGHGKR